MAQLMPLPITISCFSKVQIGFTFLVPAHPGSPRKGAVKRVCVCVCLDPLGEGTVLREHLPAYCLVQGISRLFQHEQFFGRWQE